VNGRDFLVIGENIHATRVLLQKSERISANKEGEEAIVFVDEGGVTRHLRIPEYETTSQPYQEGRSKHVRVAVQIAMAGTEPDCSTALSYLRTLAQRQVRSGAHFLDVNVDEISNKLEDSLRRCASSSRPSFRSSTSRSRSTRPTSRSSAQA
jgi:hypothetical protein